MLEPPVLIRYWAMTEDNLEQLFFSDFNSQGERLRSGGRLVHYTSAEAAARIISGRQVWLRNALLMNDFSEIQYGLNCLYSAWGSLAGDSFKLWLDRVLPGFRSQLEQLFDEHTAGLRVATFMMSLSDHAESEDDIGRLSMWRAYGGKCGVALVLNSTIFVSITDELKVYSAPVRYLSVSDFTKWFERWSSNLVAHEAEIGTIPDRRAHV